MAPKQRGQVTGGRGRVFSNAVADVHVGSGFTALGNITFVKPPSPTNGTYLRDELEGLALSNSAFDFRNLKRALIDRSRTKAILFADRFNVSRELLLVLANAQSEAFDAVLRCSVALCWDLQLEFVSVIESFHYAVNAGCFDAHGYLIPNAERVRLIFLAQVAWLREIGRAIVVASSSTAMPTEEAAQEIVALDGMNPTTLPALQVLAKLYGRLACDGKEFIRRLSMETFAVLARRIPSAARLLLDHCACHHLQHAPRGNAPDKTSVDDDELENDDDGDSTVSDAEERVHLSPHSKVTLPRIASSLTTMIVECVQGVRGGALTPKADDTWLALTRVLDGSTAPGPENQPILVALTRRCFFDAARVLFFNVRKHPSRTTVVMQIWHTAFAQIYFPLDSKASALDNVCAAAAGCVSDFGLLTLLSDNGASNSAVGVSRQQEEAIAAAKTIKEIFNQMGHLTREESTNAPEEQQLRASSMMIASFAETIASSSHSAAVKEIERVAGFSITQLLSQLVVVNIFAGGREPNVHSEVRQELLLVVIHDLAKAATGSDSVGSGTRKAPRRDSTAGAAACHHDDVALPPWLVTLFTDVLTAAIENHQFEFAARILSALEPISSTSRSINVGVERKLRDRLSRSKVAVLSCCAHALDRCVEQLQTVASASSDSHERVQNEIFLRIAVCDMLLHSIVTPASCALEYRTVENKSEFGHALTRFVVALAACHAAHDTVNHVAHSEPNAKAIITDARLADMVNAWRVALSTTDVPWPVSKLVDSRTSATTTTASELERLLRAVTSNLNGEVSNSAVALNAIVRRLAQQSTDAAQRRIIETTLQREFTAPDGAVLRCLASRHRGLRVAALQLLWLQSHRASALLAVGDRLSLAAVAKSGVPSDADGGRARVLVALLTAELSNPLDGTGAGIDAQKIALGPLHFEAQSAVGRYDGAFWCRVAHGMIGLFYHKFADAWTVAAQILSALLSADGLRSAIWTSIRTTVLELTSTDVMASTTDSTKKKTEEKIGGVGTAACVSDVTQRTVGEYKKARCLYSQLASLDEFTAAWENLNPYDGHCHSVESTTLASLRKSTSQLNSLDEGVSPATVGRTLLTSVLSTAANECSDVGLDVWSLAAAWTAWLDRRSARFATTVAEQMCNAALKALVKTPLSASNDSVERASLIASCTNLLSYPKEEVQKSAAEALQWLNVPPFNDSALFAALLPYCSSRMKSTMGHVNAAVVRPDQLDPSVQVSFVTSVVLLTLPRLVGSTAAASQLGRQVTQLKRRVLEMVIALPVALANQVISIVIVRLLPQQDQEAPQAVRTMPGRKSTIRSPVVEQVQRFLSLVETANARPQRDAARLLRSAETLASFFSEFIAIAPPELTATFAADILAFAIAGYSLPSTLQIAAGHRDPHVASSLRKKSATLVLNVLYANPDVCAESCSASTEAINRFSAFVKSVAENTHEWLTGSNVAGDDTMASAPGTLRGGCALVIRVLHRMVFDDGLRKLLAYPALADTVDTVTQHVLHAAQSAATDASTRTVINSAAVYHCLNMISALFQASDELVLGGAKKSKQRDSTAYSIFHSYVNRRAADVIGHLVRMASLGCDVRGHGSVTWIAPALWRAVIQCAADCSRRLGQCDSTHPLAAELRVEELLLELVGVLIRLLTSATAQSDPVHSDVAAQIAEQVLRVVVNNRIDTDATVPELKAKVAAFMAMVPNLLISLKPPQSRAAVCNISSLCSAIAFESPRVAQEISVFVQAVNAQRDDHSTDFDMVFAALHRMTMALRSTVMNPTAERSASSRHRTSQRRQRDGQSTAESVPSTLLAVEFTEIEHCSPHDFILGMKLVTASAAYLIRDREDSTRKLAGRLLSAVVKRCAGVDGLLANTTPLSPLVSIIRPLLLPCLRRGAAATDVNIRHEHVVALGFLGRSYPIAFPSLAVLSDPNNSSSGFFNAIASTQHGVRMGALAQLRRRAAEIAPRDHLRLFVPLLVSYLRDFAQGKRAADLSEGKAKGFCEGAVNTLASIAASLPWFGYKRVLSLIIAQAEEEASLRFLMFKALGVLLSKLSGVIDSVANAPQDGSASSDEENIAELSLTAVPKPFVDPVSESNRTKGIVYTLEHDILPRLFAMFCAKLSSTTDLSTSKQAKPVDAAVAIKSSTTADLAVATCIVRVLEHVPNGFQTHAATILHEIVLRLRTKKDKARENARKILCATLHDIGPSALPFTLTYLQDSFVHGYQLHVLGYTIVSVLEALKDKFQDQAREYIQAHPQGAHRTDLPFLDRCADRLLTCFVNDYLGVVAMQKEQSEVASTMMEVKRSRALHGFTFLAQHCLAPEFMPKIVRCIQSLLAPPSTIEESNRSALASSSPAADGVATNATRMGTNTRFLVGEKRGGVDIAFYDRVRLIAVRCARALVENATTSPADMLQITLNILADNVAEREKKINEFEAKEGYRRVRGNIEKHTAAKKMTRKELFERTFRIAERPERIDVDFASRAVLATGTQQKQKMRRYVGRMAQRTNNAAKSLLTDDPATALVVDCVDEFALHLLLAELKRELGLKHGPNSSSANPMTTDEDDTNATPTTQKDDDTALDALADRDLEANLETEEPKRGQREAADSSGGKIDRTVLDGCLSVVLRIVAAECSDAVTTTAVDVLQALLAIRPPLPSAGRSLSRVIDFAFVLMERGGTIKLRALRLISAALSSHPELRLTEESSSTLTAVIRAEVLERSSHLSIALTVLAALASRPQHPIVEVYDLIPLVTETLLQMASVLPIRNKCVAVLSKFLTLYPMSRDKLRSHFDQLTKNLTFPDSAGRVAILEVFKVLTYRLPTLLLREEARLLIIAFIGLSASSTELPEVRELAADVSVSLMTNAGLDLFPPLIQKWSTTEGHTSVHLAAAQATLVYAAATIAVATDGTVTAKQAFEHATSGQLTNERLNWTSTKADTIGARVHASFHWAIPLVHAELLRVVEHERQKSASPDSWATTFLYLRATEMVSAVAPIPIFDDPGWRGRDAGPGPSTCHAIETVVWRFLVRHGHPFVRAVSWRIVDAFANDYVQSHFGVLNQTSSVDTSARLTPFISSKNGVTNVGSEEITQRAVKCIARCVTLFSDLDAKDSSRYDVSQMIYHNRGRSARIRIVVFFMRLLMANVPSHNASKIGEVLDIFTRFAAPVTVSGTVAGWVVRSVTLIQCFVACVIAFDRFANGREGAEWDDRWTVVQAATHHFLPFLAICLSSRSGEVHALVPERAGEAARALESLAAIGDDVATRLSEEKQKLSS